MYSRITETDDIEYLALRAIHRRTDFFIGYKVHEMQIKIKRDGLLNKPFCQLNFND